MCVPCNYTQSENNLFLSIIISTSQDITLATFGQLQAFNPDTDSVTAYIERVHLFFAANEIPDKKTVAVFLSTIEGKTYELLRNLVSPSPPESLKLSELTDILKRHYEPKPLVIAERFHFHCRFQTADELIAEFMAQLCRLSKHCDFKEYLDHGASSARPFGMRSTQRGHPATPIGTCIGDRLGDGIGSCRAKREGTQRKRSCGSQNEDQDITESYCSWRWDGKSHGKQTLRKDDKPYVDAHIVWKAYRRHDKLDMDRFTRTRIPARYSRYQHNTLDLHVLENVRPSLALYFPPSSPACLAGQRSYVRGIIARKERERGYICYRR